MERKLDTTEIVRVADVAAGTSIGGFAISYAHASQTVTIVAGIIASITGICAAWVYIEKGLQLRRQRKRREGLGNSDNIRS